MFDQKVHGPKQMIVVYLAPVNARKVNAFHPVKDMELGHRVKEPVGNEDLEISDHVKIESALPEVSLNNGGPAEFVPDTKNGKGCAEILARVGRNGLIGMFFNLEETFKRIDHPFNLLFGILVSRPEVHDDLLANLPPSGSNTFDQVKRLVSLVATFAGGCSKIHDATICKWRILSIKLWLILKYFNRYADTTGFRNFDGKLLISLGQLCDFQS